MHVPSIDDGTEPEAGLEDRQEFGLCHDFPTKDPVQIYSGDLDTDIVLEEGLDFFDGCLGD